MVKLLFPLALAVFLLSCKTVLTNVCHSFSIFMVLPLNRFITHDKAPRGFSAPYYVNTALLLSLYMQTSTTNFLLCSRVSSAAEILCNNNANASQPVGVPGCNNLYPHTKKPPYKQTKSDEFRIRLWFHNTVWAGLPSKLPSQKFPEQWKILLVSDLYFFCFLMCMHYSLC